MLFKCLLVFLAISSVPTKTDGQILDTISEWNDLIKRVLEIYAELDLSETNIGEIVGDLATVEQLLNVFNFVMDNFSEQLPQEGICLVRVVLDSDGETLEQIRELVAESLYYYQLTQERKELTAECDSYDPSTVLGLIAQQNCRAKLQHLELQITNSNAKIRLQLVGLSGAMSQGLNCLSSSK